MNLPTIFFFLQLILVVRSASTGCSLPEHPSNGKWTVLGSETGSFQPGNVVKPSTTLHVTCDESYKLLGTQLGICGRDGEWEWQIRMGECSKLCPALNNTNQVTVTCSTLDSETGDFVRVKCSEATHGAIAQFECAQYYTIVVDNSTMDIKSGGSGLSKCLNGRWSVDKPNCNPKCGLKTLTGVPLSVNGTNVAEGDYPWQVALYISTGKNYEFQCGASLISEQVVITAAHCVTSSDGSAMNANLYAVGAGKLYRDFKDRRDPDAQLIRASRIFVPRTYKGIKQNFLADVAIVIPGAAFRLTYKIQPICVDWKKKFKKKFFQPSNTGFVSGWGAVDEQGQAADVLRELEVPFVKRQECAKAISDSDESFITSDKICLGYVNKSRAVCAGDSGGGLVFKNSFDDRFYLTGIVSISPDRKFGTSCNSQLYALYTEVYFHLDFIREIAAEFQIKEVAIPSKPTKDEDSFTYSQNCIVPASIPNGQYQLRGGYLYPGNMVEPGTVLSVKCNTGFKLVGSALNLCTGKPGKPWGSPMASCGGLCSKVTASGSSHHAYYRKNGKNALLADEYENRTTVTFACNNGRPSYGICKSGAWNPEPSCSPSDCGTIKNGEANRFPWLAAIYTRNPKKIVCGGTIVNQRAIITAAHCVAEFDGGVAKPPGEFAMSIGQSTEPNIGIYRIIMPERFRGYSGNFVADIAVIITDVPITFTDDIQPICVDWMFNPKDNNIQRGIVSGWGQGRRSQGDKLRVKVLELPFEPLAECKRKIPNGHERFLTDDKSCLARPSKDSEIVCKGDGGNGVFTKVQSDNKYYLLGVISTAFGGQCGGLTGVTDISAYKNTEIYEAILWYA